ncbi:SPIR1 protein, partial [Scytalopus superciliaris]|nr:SPIR1 protein [Scytalopus superciliaris]
MEPLRCEQRITKVSLAELLRCFEHPLSEEQAWAICFQCCCKMEQLAWELCPPLHSVFIKGSGSIFIHADGAASFKVYHKSGKSTDVGIIQQSEDKLLEYLGVVIYEALDWGIDSQVERELSAPLEKLLCLMLKLDDEPMKPAVTLQDVIKACEEHLPRPSEATRHYEMTCRRLFDEYMELQKLVTIIQTSKEVHLGSPLSCYFPFTFTHSPTVDLSLPGFSEAPVWPSVICELQAGVRLRKASERPQPRVSPRGCARSPYELLLDDIQHKRYTLRKVSDFENICSTSFLSVPLPMELFCHCLLCPLALCGAMLCLQVLERQLKEPVPWEPSWHELPRAQIKQPQKVQSAAAQEKGSRPKGTCY